MTVKSNILNIATIAIKIYVNGVMAMIIIK